MCRGRIDHGVGCVSKIRGKPVESHCKHKLQHQAKPEDRDNPDYAPIETNYDIWKLVPICSAQNSGPNSHNGSDYHPSDCQLDRCWEFLSNHAEEIGRASCRERV